MADLEADFRTLLRDVSNLERQVYNLRLGVQGDDGSGGLKGSIEGVVAQIREVSGQVTLIARQQETDGRTLRVSIWLPTVVSIIAIVIAAISLAVALGSG